LEREKYTEQEVSLVVSWNTVEIGMQVQKGLKSYFGDCHYDIMTGFT